MLSTMKPTAKISAAATTTGEYAVILTCLVLPLSTSLTSLFSVLAFLCWLLSRQYMTLPRQMISHPTVLCAMLLFTLLIAGLFYGPAPLDESLRTLSKYRELLWFPMAIALLSGKMRQQKMAEYAFIVGCTLLLLASYFIYFGILPPHKYGHSIVYHITHSFFMALLCFWTLHNAINSKKLRIPWLILFGAAAANLIFICPGRVGMVLFILLMLLVIVQRCTPKIATVGILILTVTITTGYLLSDNVQERTAQAISEVKQYTPGTSRTSLGMRFDWWHNCINLIEKKPIFGYGTGSFMLAQQEVKEEATRPTNNPHNEYLFLGVQSGLVGMALYLLLFASLLFEAHRLPKEKKYLVQGIVLAMFSGCLANSFLFDSQQGHFFAFVSAIYIAAATPQRETNNQEHNT